MFNNFAGCLASVFRWLSGSGNTWRIQRLCIASAVTLALTACIAAGNKQVTPTPIPTPVIPVKPVYEVQRGDISQQVTFTGRVAPLLAAELAFGTDGQVDQVLVRAGDRMQTGEVLATLKTGSQKYELRRAEIALELAQLDLDLAQEQRIVASQTHSMTLELREYELEEAQIDLDNIVRTGETGSPAIQAEMKLRMAQLALELAQQQAALNAIESQTGLVVKERQVELAQIALDEIQAQIAESRILAPFTGQVVSVYIEDETAAEAFKTAIVFVDTTELELRAEPGDADLKLLQEGMPVLISSPSQPGVILEGAVRSLPYPYGSGQVSEDEARITLSSPTALSGSDLGDLMQITVVIAQKTGILWLPPQAVRTYDGRKFVVIQAGEGQRRVDVKLGIQSDDRVEIVEGLEVGQIVISP